jgi:hypothetical protein
MPSFPNKEIPVKMSSSFGSSLTTESTSTHINATPDDIAYKNIHHLLPILKKNTICSLKCSSNLLSMYTIYYLNKYNTQAYTVQLYKLVNSFYEQV